MNIYTDKKKLPFAEWKKFWQKQYCRECDTGIPNPLVCYVCVQQKRFFTCAKCGCYRVVYEREVCGGSYDTGACLCEKCRTIIQQVEVCHEYFRGGYCEGHMIHDYSTVEIAREVKLFFRGDNLWAKIFCRFCQKKVAVVKLGCVCYKEQKQHEHKYSTTICLNCHKGYSPRKLEERGWKIRYREYVEEWEWRQEIAANRDIRGAYQLYGGIGYYSHCSFCDHLIKGQETHKKPLEKNMVQFWSGDKKDSRLLCDWCLVRREVLGELKIVDKVEVYWLRQGFSKCEVCEKKLGAASKMGKPKNRNRAFGFWGLKVRKHILCLECIKENYQEQLTPERRKVLTKYLKRGYV